MGNLVRVPLTNVRKKPIETLTIEQFNQIAAYLKNGVPDGADIVPVSAIGFFLTKTGKQELIFDFKVGEDIHGNDIFIGRDGGGGDPPLFPVKK